MKTNNLYTVCLNSLYFDLARKKPKLGFSTIQFKCKFNSLLLFYCTVVEFFLVEKSFKFSFIIIITIVSLAVSLTLNIR